MKLLFIGNSATYVHDIPGTLTRLAAQAGLALTTAQITPGGCELAMHADASTDLGRQVLQTIRQGFDFVILQDNGNCITSPEKRAACANACQTLAEVITESGAKPCFYIRPPYGKPLAGLSPLEQCAQFDAFFTDLAARYGFTCFPVSRAFAEAIRTLPYPLWGPDNAHTSPFGAYLAVCTFFAVLTGRSAAALTADTIPADAARNLAAAVDKILPSPLQSG